MSTRDMVLAARSRIEARTGDVALVFEGPVEEDDLALAEELLGASFPPGYHELMTTLGPFKLASSWADRSRCFELLSPARVVEETERYRRLSATVDAATRRRAAQCAILQFDASPVDFHVLRLEDGTVHRDTHDDANT